MNEGFLVREHHLTKRRDELEDVIRSLAPRIPKHELGAIVDHALDSIGLQTASLETAAWLSLVAYVWHVHTEYDELLRQGYDVDSARHFVVSNMQAVLTGWGVKRRLASASD